MTNYVSDGMLNLIHFTSQDEMTLTKINRKNRTGIRRCRLEKGNATVRNGPIIKLP